jgi:hypothetical protein
MYIEQNGGKQNILALARVKTTRETVNMDVILTYICSYYIFNALDLQKSLEKTIVKMFFLKRRLLSCKNDK